MARFKEKIQAVNLRKEGESIGDIALKLNVSKSIVSRWCRDIALTKEQINHLHKKMMVGSYKGRMKFLEKVRSARKAETERLYKKGIEKISKLNKRDLLIAGTALYWAEGTKTMSTEQIGFSNSSPKMILWMLKWFGEIFGITKDRFVLQIRINQIHKNRVKEVEHYWSKITRISLNQFTKTILIRTVSKKVYFENNHYGTVRISVRRGTQIRREILGLIEGLSRI